jgi:uncharacterized protein YcsI (UPF0317 family)
MEQDLTVSPRQVRELIRRGELVRPTAGLCPGYVQANMAIVPKDLAYDFLLFCQRNPKPCPILDVTDVGSAEPRWLAPRADIRFDIPKYGCGNAANWLMNRPMSLNIGGKIW